MNATKSDSDSDSDDTLTSNACTDSSPEDSDHGDISDSESISLSVVSTTSTVTSKKTPNPNKKRVSFKPGDSLVLIYEIPNRAMLGLKSDSESSDDDDDSDEDSDDEDSDDDSDEDSEEDNENQKDINNVNKRKTSKCLPKLLSVKQVSRRNNVECKTEIKRNSRKVAQLIGLNLNPTQQSTQKKRTKRTSRMRVDRGDKDKIAKKEPHAKAIVVDEVKRKKVNTRMSRGFSAISNQSQHSKSGRGRKNRRFLEIKATLQPNSSDTSSVTSGVTKYKQDLKPSIATLDSQGAISVCGKTISQKLTQRSRLQPTSFRLAKTRLTSASVDKPVTSSVTSLDREKYTVTPNVKQAMSATYECLQSLKRLDPDNMNAKNKRNYAWQVANGRISSHQLRTPSILPFWDSLQNSVIDNSVIKFPS